MKYFYSSLILYKSRSPSSCCAMTCELPITYALRLQVTYTHAHFVANEGVVNSKTGFPYFPLVTVSAICKSILYLTRYYTFIYLSPVPTTILISNIFSSKLSSHFYNTRQYVKRRKSQRHPQFYKKINYIYKTIT